MVLLIATAASATSSLAAIGYLKYEPHSSHPAVALQFESAEPVEPIPMQLRDIPSIGRHLQKDQTKFTIRQLKILEGIWAVETGQHPGGKSCPMGDAGELGPFQITYDYWYDTMGPNVDIIYPNEEALIIAYRSHTRSVWGSLSIVRRYMMRYCPEAWKRGDAEAISRTHNGGPKGLIRASAVPYWKKVRKVLGE